MFEKSLFSSSSRVTRHLPGRRESSTEVLRSWKSESQIAHSLGRYEEEVENSVVRVVGDTRRNMWLGKKVGRSEFVTPSLPLLPYHPLPTVPSPFYITLLNLLKTHNGVTKILLPLESPRIYWMVHN